MYQYNPLKHPINIKPYFSYDPNENQNTIRTKNLHINETL